MPILSQRRLFIRDKSLLFANCSSILSNISSEAEYSLRCVRMFYACRRKTIAARADVDFAFDSAEQYEAPFSINGLVPRLSSMRKVSLRVLRHAVSDDATTMAAATNSFHLLAVFFLLLSAARARARNTLSITPHLAYRERNSVTYYPTASPRLPRSRRASAFSSVP